MRQMLSTCVKCLCGGRREREIGARVGVSVCVECVSLCMDVGPGVTDIGHKLEVNIKNKKSNKSSQKSSILIITCNVDKGRSIAVC